VLNAPARFLLLFLGLLFLAGCQHELRNQPRYRPLDESVAFGASAREPVPNTVARGLLWEDEHLYRGITDGEPAETFPFEITREILDLGQDRYNIFCSPCHSPLGDGQGIAVLQGFPQPPSFHDERLREAPPGYIFNVITHGTGVMFSYAHDIPPDDRWAIVAYIRALQLSQAGAMEDVPQDQLQTLQAGQP
jgi:hypothetical protein